MMRVYTKVKAARMEEREWSIAMKLLRLDNLGVTASLIKHGKLTILFS